MNVLQPPPSPPTMPDYNGLGTDDIGGFRYGIGVSIGVLLLITTITLTSYFCTRNQLSSSASRTNQDSTRVHHHHHHHVIIDVVSGLDEDTIQSYPKILYSEAKGHSTASCCPICLGDYRGKHCSGNFQTANTSSTSNVSTRGLDSILRVLSAGPRRFRLLSLLPSPRLSL